MCEAVFRTTSSGALPVLANTGFRFCCKTNRKQYILAPTGVPGERPKWHSDRQASSECSLLAIWIDGCRANAQAGKEGRSGKLGKLSKPGRAGRRGRLGKPGRAVKSGKSGRLGKQGTKHAKDTVHSWRELCGAERSEAPRSGSRGGLFHLREVK